MNEIESLRRQIAVLKQEKQAHQEQSRSQAEVANQVRTRVAEAVERGARDLRRMLVQCAQGGNHRALEVHADAMGRVDLFDVLATMLGAHRMTEVLLASIDEIPVGLDREARLARIAELDAELDRLELAEEKLITEAELDGSVDIPRRRVDARPEIVLAVQE